MTGAIWATGFIARLKPLRKQKQACVHKAIRRSRQQILCCRPKLLNRCALHGCIEHGLLPVQERKRALCTD